MSGRHLYKSLLMTTGIMLAVSGPAFAQQQDCEQQLSQVEEDIQQVDLASATQQAINELIDEARSFAEEGNEQRCLQVVGDIEGMMATGGQQAQQQGEGGAEIIVEEQPSEIVVTEQPPTVIVEQQPPEVAVETQQPDVQVETPTPDVAVQEAQPDVQVQESGQPEVMVEQEGQAEVMVQEQQAQQQQDVQSQLNEMTAGDISGQELVDSQGQTLGQIEMVVIDEQQGELYMVVMAEGQDGQQVVVPASEIEQVTDDDNMQTGLSQQELQGMSQYQEGQYLEIAEDEQIGQAVQAAKAQQQQ